MSEAKISGMRMARANENDLKMAETLLLILCDAFEDGVIPRDLNGNWQDIENIPYFDESQYDDLKLLYDRIKECFDLAPGGLSRVVWGMSCIMDSGLIDKTVDYLRPAEVKG